MDGIILYEHFQFIDKQGDSLYQCPHFFVDFGPRGPFDGHWQYIKLEHDRWCSLEGYKRIKIFPETFHPAQYGKVYKDRSIVLPSYLLNRLKHNGKTVFVDLQNKYSFLKPTDVIYVAGADDGNYKTYLEVTYRYKSMLAALSEQQPNLKWDLEQDGQKLEPSREVDVLELKRVYDHELERGTD